MTDDQRSGMSLRKTLTLDADGVRKLDEINAWLCDPDPNAKRPEWMLELLPPTLPKGHPLEGTL